MSGDLPNPGDYYATDIAGKPILIVRNNEGKAQAFLNACRHRGVKLADGPDEAYAKASQILGMDIKGHTVHTVLIAQAVVDELNLAARAHGTSEVAKQAAPNFLRECLAYDWPGNVRELQERVRRAYLASGDVIETLRADEAGTAHGLDLNGSRVQVTVGTPLADVEEMLIRATLDAVGGTRHRAASLLGISPKTLYNKLQRMRLN